MDIPSNGLSRSSRCSWHEVGSKMLPESRWFVDCRWQKKYSQEYKKAANAVSAKLESSYTKRYVDSYNKAADYMNKEGISKFNSQQQKKYGDEYSKRSEYENEYMEFFGQRLAKEFNKSLNEFYNTDADYKKPKELVDKYSMTQWDELAKNNEAMVEEVRRAVEKGK